MGYISRWLNFNAIVQLATKHPDWRFVFIGPSDIDLSKFRSYKNLFFLGSKPYEILPEYVARFDVATIPFIINDLTNDVNPVKIYEYFSLGKPVVASKIPELIPYESNCYLGENTTDLVSQVEKAVNDFLAKRSLDETVQKRKIIALNNTWHVRAEAIIKILESHLSLQHIKNGQNEQ